MELRGAICDMTASIKKYFSNFYKKNSSEFTCLKGL